MPKRAAALVSSCILIVLVCAGAVIAAGGSGSAAAANELIVCGWDEVFILDLSGGSESQPKKVWSWKASQRPELPAHVKNRFGTTDDCKPVDGGRRILITSSGDGIALVDRKTGEAVFWATGGNAHSAELLPGGRIAVALSYTEGGLPGNRLDVFDVRVPEKVVCSCELTGGHGVVWDGKRKLLWALSGEDVRAYELVDWNSSKPSLKLIGRYDLPEPGGHDLLAVPGTSALTVTTMRHCWLFDRDKHSFKLHRLLSEAPDVKSICVNPSTGQLAYMQGGQENWWTDTIHLLSPNRTLRFPGARLYKARWANASD